MTFSNSCTHNTTDANSQMYDTTSNLTLKCSSNEPAAPFRLCSCHADGHNQLKKDLRTAQATLTSSIEKTQRDVQLHQALHKERMDLIVSLRTQLQEVQDAARLAQAKADELEKSLATKRLVPQRLVQNNNISELSKSLRNFLSYEKSLKKDDMCITPNITRNEISSRDLGPEPRDFMIDALEKILSQSSSYIESTMSRRHVV